MPVGNSLKLCDFEPNGGGGKGGAARSYSMWQDSLLTFAEHCVVPALLQEQCESKNIAK